MSLLKEGDGVNFQKASCTLDGCVKIYTSRVDSVATETGKLLSGLAESANSNNKRKKDGRDDAGATNADGEDGEGADNDEDGADDDGEGGGGRRRPKKRVCDSKKTPAPDDLLD
jgi:condensin complex subunit 2